MAGPKVVVDVVLMTPVAWFVSTAVGAVTVVLPWSTELFAVYMGLLTLAPSPERTPSAAVTALATVGSEKAFGKVWEET
jgi:hypothetical protein